MYLTTVTLDDGACIHVHPLMGMHPKECLVLVCQCVVDLPLVDWRLAMWLTFVLSSFNLTGNHIDRATPTQAVLRLAIDVIMQLSNTQHAH